ncbi:hypothetical protein BpHYR1_048946 [Brachionus plicatilis]|uniref:Uncharacterized protein n=1 Tax=Brachionus plicatilis TaxID=10195 RepID=A0A3M7QUL6_BRAPC|nr:hypothetical protein BpHYR1_048946 [Brachionus plicatilis]
MRLILCDQNIKSIPIKCNKKKSQKNIFCLEYFIIYPKKLLGTLFFLELIKSQRGRNKLLY